MQSSEIKSVVAELKRIHTHANPPDVSAEKQPGAPADSGAAAADEPPKSLFVTTAFRLLKDIANRPEPSLAQKVDQHDDDSPTHYEKIQGLLRERNDERLRQEHLIDRLLDGMQSSGTATAAAVPVQQEMRILLSPEGRGAGRFMVTNEAADRTTLAFSALPLGADTTLRDRLDVSFDPPAPQLEANETATVTLRARITPTPDDPIIGIAVRVLAGEQPLARLWVDLIAAPSTSPKE